MSWGLSFQDNVLSSEFNHGRMSACCIWRNGVIEVWHKVILGYCELWPWSLRTPVFCKCVFTMWLRRSKSTCDHAQAWGIRGYRSSQKLTHRYSTISCEMNFVVLITVLLRSTRMTIFIHVQNAEMGAQKKLYKSTHTPRLLRLLS